MKMKTIRISILCVVILFLAAPLLHSQDFSKYRSFSFGTNLATVLKHTDQKMADVKVVHQHPALIQELNWWPPTISGSANRSDTAQQILFSFYNGELYKISVTYDRSAIEGLTAEDMVQSISARYGPPMKTATEDKLPSSEESYSSPSPFASWENSQSSLYLVRSFTDKFGLVMFSKSLNGQAETAIAKAVKLEEQERPQKEADLRKKESDDLETARQKNKKVFQP
jgi:hypothetical protein